MLPGLRVASISAHFNRWWLLSQALWAIFVVRLILIIDVNKSQESGFFAMLTWRLVRALKPVIGSDSHDIVQPQVLIVAPVVFTLILLIRGFRRRRALLSFVEGPILVCGIPVVIYLINFNHENRVADWLEVCAIAAGVLISVLRDNRLGWVIFICLVVFHFSFWLEADWKWQFVNNAALLSWGYCVKLANEVADELRLNGAKES